MSPASTYDRVAKSLHWLIALAIIFMLVLGWMLEDLQGQDKFRAFQLHKSVGITILLLSLIRLGWRLTHRFPVLPETMSKTEKLAAHLGHWGLYALMIVMPLTGWVIVSTSKLAIPTLLFGIVPWPHLPMLPDLENKRAIHEIGKNMHGILATAMAGLAGVHALAALKHHFISRDDILLRMTPNFLARPLQCLRGKKS